MSILGRKRKSKYYSLNPILSYDATYNIIIGERSNGKSYSCLKYGLEKYIKSGEQFAIVRRWGEDFKGKRGQSIFNGIVENKEISKLTNDTWNGVYYYASRWYLCRFENGQKKEVCEEPFAYGFSVASMEHDKSTAFPKITTIIFDEFISRTGYLPDEFILFMNVCSTIIRDRNNVKIFMLGNTVNKYCPYFAEMGLRHVKSMQQGTIDVYHYGDSRLIVAVEYCAENKQGKESDFYFAFDNPKLSMITGGGWELDIYPHLPCKYLPKDIMFVYFIKFDSDILQCEIIRNKNGSYTYIHRKTTPIKNENKDLVFSPEYTNYKNYRRRINKPTDNLGKKIASYFVRDKVFYQDNETGEVVRNYIKWCKSQS